MEKNNFKLVVSILLVSFAFFTRTFSQEYYDYKNKELKWEMRIPNTFYIINGWELDEQSEDLKKLYKLENAESRKTDEILSVLSVDGAVKLEIKYLSKNSDSIDISKIQPVFDEMAIVDADAPPLKPIETNISGKPFYYYNFTPPSFFDDRNVTANMFYIGAVNDAVVQIHLTGPRYSEISNDGVFIYHGSRIK